MHQLIVCRQEDELVQNQLIFRGQVDDPQGRSNFLLGYTGQNTVHLERPFRGTVIAPDASVVLSTQPSGHEGAFFARGVEVHQDTPVRPRPFAHELYEIPSPAKLRPPPRSGFGATLSAQRDAIFMLGGTLDSGALAGDLWAFDVSRKIWQRQRITGDAPATVLAVAFASSSQQLFFIDQTSSQRRLVAYSFQTAEASVLTGWSSSAPLEPLSLTVDESGRLVVSGSRAGENQHRVVIFDVATGNELGITEPLAAFLSHGLHF